MEELPLISQTFWTTKDLKTEETAKKIADLMAAREDEFMPAAFFGGKITRNRNRNYDKSRMQEYIEALSEPDVYYVVLSNNDRKKCEVTFEFTVTKSIWFNVVNFNVAHSYFTGEERLKKFLDTGRKIENIIEPLYGMVHDVMDSNYILTEIAKEETYRIHEKIPAAFWGNYFGKHYIEKIGREKLLAFKGYKVEQLDNGDIYVQTSPSPFNPTSHKDRKAQRELTKLIITKNYKPAFRRSGYIWMTRDQKNYRPLVGPINKPFIEMSKEESQQYFDWFISHIDERSEYLRQKVSKGLSIPIESLDFSLESLKPIWKWFLQVAEISNVPRKVLKQREKSLEGQPPMIKQMLLRKEPQLSIFTECILRDIGMYVAKMFTSNYPVLKWTIKRTPKRYIYVNEPLIIGFIDDNKDYPKPFCPDLEPISIAHTPAMKLLREIQPYEDDLYNECKKWVGWIPKNEQNKKIVLEKYQAKVDN